MIREIMRACSLCKAEKPISCFIKSRKSPSGLGFVCSECNKSRHVEWYKKNRLEQVLKNKQRRITNRSASRAQLRVQYALDHGTIKALPCFCCGDKAEAHHPNYDAPLDIVWLCRAHHRQAHLLAMEFR